MSGPKQDKKIKLHVRIPKLPLPYRIALYLMMMVFAALSVWNVITERLPFEAGIAVYVAAALTLFSGIYYLITDIVFYSKMIRQSERIAVSYPMKLAGDAGVRFHFFLFSGMVSNVIFAIFNGIIAIYSRSPWLGTLSAYYILLSLMRIMAVQKDRELSKEQDGHKREKEEL